MPARAPSSRRASLGLRSLLLSGGFVGGVLGGALLGAACGGSDPDPATVVVGDGTSDVDLPLAHPDDPLQLVLQAAGRAGATPDAVRIRLGRDVVPGDLVGSEALAGTELVVEPAVDGTLRWVERDVLEFRPTTGFRPGTDYTVRLAALQTLDETVTPPADGAWQTTFSAPELELLRLAPQRRDRAGQVAELDLVFTAPVDAGAVAERLTVTVDGRAVRPDRVQAGGTPATVRVRLTGPAIAAEEARVVAEVAPGLPWAWDAAVVTDGDSASVELVDGKPVEVLAVLVKEGARGHYIDVVCNDNAVEQTRWYWDRDTWDGWDVSTRCLLDEASADAVHLSTDDDVTVAQSPGGFRIFGDLTRGPVDLRIDAGATTVDGGVFAEAWEGSLVVPARQPRLTLDASGRYLPRDRWSGLSLSHVNVDAVDVKVRHVPVDNLAFWLSGGEDADARTSDLVADQRVALEGPQDERADTWLDLSALVPAPERGVYQIEVADTDGAAGAKARLLLTDMHLVAKRADVRPGEPFSREVRAWALDVHDNDPVSGAEIQLLKPSGMPLATCTTGADGGCLLAPPVDAVDPTAPVALVARKGDDLTYLRFEDVPLRPDADVSGQPYRVDAALRSAMWTDRGVYRPGDTARVGALLRSDAFGAPDAGLPVVLKVYDPSRREIRREALQTNAAGMVAADVPFADFATTGSWRVALEVGDQELGSTTFAVEEFVPERLAVDLASLPGPDGDGWLSSEDVPFQVDARWLFGGSAGGSRVEVTCELRPGAFQPEGSGSGRWSYGPTWLDRSRMAATEIAALDRRLDDDGHLSFRCPAADRSGAVLGSAEMVARVAVFEGDSGRTTKEVAAVPVHPARHYLGLSTSRDQVADGDVVKVDGRVVGWDGRALSGAVEQVELRLYRMEEEYGWVYDQARDDTVYRRVLRRVLESEQTVTVSGGAFSESLSIPARAAGWLIDVRGGGAHTERYLQGDGRRWYWDPYDSWVDQTPKPQQAASLELELPAQADPGDEITVKTTAPYRGRMLVAVETDRLQHHQWLDVEPGPVAVQVPLDVDDGDGGDFAPNVYVSALLVKDPHLESAAAYLPDRAAGVASVALRPAAWSHEVALSVPDEVRPWSTLDVSLDVGPPGGDGPVYATVAVVDEGILQLTDFDTPDPRDQIFARRALGVQSFETVGWTLSRQAARGAPSTGGDAAGGVGRVQAIQPLALWSGLVQVPASGKLDLSFDVPGYRGKLRVMAVTADATRMGAAEASVVVRDPIVLQTTLPRFLVAGDTATVPVRLTNMSGAARDVTVDVQIEPMDLGLPALAEADAPAVVVADVPSAPLSLADGAADTALVTLRAERAPAAVKLIVTATAGSLVSREERQLPVALAAPEQQRVQLVKLGRGDNDLGGALSGWAPGTDRSTIWVTTNPHADALAGLGHLVRYPYGCVEQTTSSTRPLLYVRDAVEHLDPALVADASVDEMVQAGIERVLSMQTPSGGMAYWPGGHHPNTWGTAYATHMLLDARDAGFAVPPQALDHALDWLETRVGGQISGDNDLAYAHYVLARADRARAAQALKALEALEAAAGSDDRRWERVRRDESRYLLMGALYLGGDRRYADALDEQLVVERDDSRANDWTFWSALRGAGLRLTVHQDTVGAAGASAARGDAAAERLASWISSQQPRRWTTQELAWAITALGRRADTVQAPGGLALAVDGQAVSGGDDGSWGLRGAAGAGPVRLTVGSLPADAWAYVSTRGVPSDRPMEVGGDGLALTRTFVDGQGRALDPARLPLGTALYVRVDIQNTSGRSVQNIALVDRLPAGWEIENPRLSGEDRPDWADSLDLWRVDHMNLRDDRVEVFGELRRGETRTVVYGVRAVTAGSFVHPPVSAEAMYDPELWARRAGGTVEVVGPWDGGLL